MSEQTTSNVPPFRESEISSQSSASLNNSRDRDILLDQYKLAVEMAARLSTKRQEANNFHIGLVSAFGILYSLLEKVQSPFAKATWRIALPILAVAWCAVWWVTIRSYRRINKAKWYAIYELERHLPGKPFQLEQAFLSGHTQSAGAERGQEQAHHVESPGSFTLSKLELLMPVLVGLVFLLFAAASVYSR